MSYSKIIAKILNVGDSDISDGLTYLHKIRLYQEHLSEIENQGIQFILDYYEKYNRFPSPQTFIDNFFDSMYNGGYLRDSLPHLFKIFIKDLQDRHTRKIQSCVDDMLVRGDYSSFHVMSLLEKMPREISDDVKDALHDFDVMADDLFAGIEHGTGFTLGLGKAIDEEIGLLKAGRMFGLVAHQKSGKTTILANVAIKAFISGLKVLLCTYEITKPEMYQKLFAVLGEYNTKLHNAEIGTPLHAELQAKKEVVKERLHLFHKAYGGSITIEKGANVDQINNLQKSEYDRTGKAYDLILIDNIYLMPSDNNSNNVSGSNWVDIERTIKILRTSCVGDEKMGIPPYAIFFTSQLNPNGEGLSAGDIAKSRSLAETADVILSVVPDMTCPPNGRSVYILASRHGSPNVMSNFKFDFTKTAIMIDDGAIAHRPMFTIPSPAMIATKAMVSELFEQEDEVAPTKSAEAESEEILVTETEVVDTSNELVEEVVIPTSHYSFGTTTLAPYNDMSLLKKMSAEDEKIWDSLLQICNNDPNELQKHWDLFEHLLEDKEK